jgi:syntaxin-binding protein 1
LAEALHSNLKEFYKRSKKIRPREPRATFLILDRSFDVVSPVIHDYYYQNIVYDNFNVGDNGKVKADNRMVYLNDQDELWVRFRNRHLAYVMNKVNQEAHAVIKNSKKGTTNTDDMNLQQMADLIREMPKIEEMMKNY